MNGNFQVSDEYTVNTAVVIACSVALLILLVFLGYFFINQTALITHFKEAVSLYKDDLCTNYAKGADINVIAEDDMLPLWSEKVKYLEQLNTMHKQVSTTDLFVFIYGFLSSVLIGLSGYLVKKSERHLNNVTIQYINLKKDADDYKNQLNKISDKCAKLKKNADKKEHQLRNISDQYANLKENADKLDRKFSNNEKLFFVSQIMSDAITDISTYKHSIENEYLVQFRQELRQIADYIKDIELEEIDISIIARFEQRFGTIMGLYEDTSKDSKYLITENHKKHVKKDFDEISSKLNEMQKHNL
jgi:peptidoglycan hydrolase CwlO-like protein